MVVGKVWLHRKIQDWPYYKKDSRYVHLWTHIIMAAVWKDTPYMFDGKSIILKPGQFVSGRYQLERDTGIHNQFIKRALLRWESDQQIGRHRGAKGSIITILNWGEHQGSDHQTDQQMTTKRPPSDHLVTTKEEVKTVKNVKEYTKPFEQFWKVYPRNQNKQAAFKVWNRLNGIMPEVEELILIVEKQKTWEQFKQYTPHGSTWLNNHRWEDEEHKQHSTENKIKRYSAAERFLSGDLK